MSTDALRDPISEIRITATETPTSFILAVGSNTQLALQRLRSSGMTLRQLCETPWNSITGYPKVGFPWRASVLANIAFKNQNGVPLEATVLTNRTRNRFWTEIRYTGNTGFGSLHLYLTTTSRKKADSWIAAIRCEVIEGSNKEVDNARQW